MRWHPRATHRQFIGGKPRPAGTIHAHADYRTGTACGVEPSSLPWVWMSEDFDPSVKGACPVCSRIFGG